MIVKKVPERENKTRKKEKRRHDKENQAPAPTILMIWCLVNEDPLAATFPVNISDSRTIGHLKDVIRKNINAPDNVTLS
ncbi:17678_t:CDS:2 [Dentiscutata erythropus]|uniref:17678_t:CDS:1 n=1 Tax=Dentiscutata erythropus TaxID=1348616 RepID=A0A9N8W3F0_9GLOM|nr:17678_t:CDS:2 [Dentiscutata erythropus]